MENKNILKEIGQRISQRRKAMRLTQERLAEMMDVSIQMISNLEAGKKAIRPENLIKLCYALDTSADYILLGEKSEREILKFMDDYSRLRREDQELVDSITKRLLDTYK